MRKVVIANPTVINTYKTFLATAYTVGATTLDVLSNVSFAAGDVPVIGNTGEEEAEQEQLSTITGKNTLNLSASLDFDHPKDTPIFKVAWNFVEIEWRSSSAGTFATLTQSPIQWDKLNTIYFHDAGTDNSEYRFRFYNSVTATYSEYSPTVTGSGFERNQVGYMIREVRKVINDPDGRVMSDKEIIRAFNEGQDIIRGTKDNWWFLKGENSSTTTTASDSNYALASAIGSTGNLDKILYRYNDGSATDITYPLKFKTEAEFDMLVTDNDRSDDDDVECYTLKPADSSSDAGYFEVYPTPATTGRGTFIQRYFKQITDLATVSDETVIPFPQILENFAIGQAEAIKGNENKAAIYNGLFYGKRQEGRRTIQADTGINMLSRMDAFKRRPSGQPLSLKRYRGQRAIQGLYGQRYGDNRDELREKYW